ncbi:hypothetical protein CONPUDRAFT_150545 [Coniophora puteana RWD-64-598 SS2]|uniref:DUF6593 domain-containing protein n=1 Tax=Coniophora puteana (strain RWD-64-598) TaxID=741705 RepID=A0A5M3N406_CONPW|nr:uncharacterized protein CONPUDRAFT_150545 [Coniophora puteana RWD-64-598 SS2]EIW85764.1 hypothetical protein CONPUDRAFT_150545 [Coniophora puteana RWD-64-598 SS2]
MSTAHGEPAYVITTARSLGGLRTTFHSASTGFGEKGVEGVEGRGRLVATLAKNDMLPDTVTFYARDDTRKEEKLRAEKWLSGKKDETFPASFEHAGTTFTWSARDPIKARFGPIHPALLLMSSNTIDALAWYMPSKGRGVSPQERAGLQLSPAIDTDDVLCVKVLVSCVLALQRWLAKHRGPATLPPEAGIQSWMLTSTFAG